MSLKYEAVFFIKDEDENIVKQTIKKIKKIVKEEKCNILKTEDFGTLGLNVVEFLLMEELLKFQIKKI